MPVFNPVNLGKLEKLAAETAELTAKLEQRAERAERMLSHKTLRVVLVRDDDADQPPVLVVEDAAKGPTRRGERND
jgi:hypothetical protein